ncbi:FHA domain-containing protein [Caviibacter abscessus]|uniref:FHA domain-containing protein n=1 Tax=Caviibacter abscessus TaxID=1766719 RepID=UPI000830B94C|nr:FHA domain-containing protein [Caviibacter abscessus]
MKRYTWINYFNRFINKLNTNNKQHVIKKRKNKINKDLFFIFLIFLSSIIYFFIVKNKIYAFLFNLFSFEIYLFIKLYYLVTDIYKNIDERFEYQKSIKEKNKQQLLIKRNNITRLIIKDEYGYDAEKIDITKEIYIAGKKNKNNEVDIDLSKYTNNLLISRLHFSIIKKENSWLITDLGSKNGTTLVKSDKRKLKLIKFEPQKIMSGDIIEIFKLQVLVM